MAADSPHMFPKPAPQTGPWYERKAAEFAIGESNENFITWHIRQLMQPKEEIEAMFYKHVSDRQTAAEHVLTGFAQPIKTDGYWRQPESNGHVVRSRLAPAQNIYSNVVSNLEKLESQ